MGLSADRKTAEKRGQIDSYGVKGSTKIYGGAIVAMNASGYALGATADATLKVVGVCEQQVDNSSGANGDLNVTTRRGIFGFDNGTGGDAIAAANAEALCYASDDHTVNLTDGGGTRPCVGKIKYLDPITSQVYVDVGVTSLYAANTEATGGGTAAFRARGVLTSVAAYAASGGVITANSTGAIGSQDGLTLSAGDVVVLGAGIAAAAKDAGVYTVNDPGGATKFKLTRVDWAATGTTIPQGAVVNVGGEGTNFAGSEWKFLCAGAKVFDTDDPVMYPKTFKKTVTLASGTYTVGNGGGGESLWLKSTTTSSIQLTHNTNGGTLGTAKYAAPVANRTAGVAGAASFIVNSLIDAGTVQTLDTSTVDVLVTNW
jgi:hypothetical protein